MSYLTIETDVINQTIRNALGSNLLTATTTGVTGKGTAHCTKYTMEGDLKINSDLCAPQIVMFNSYNKESAFAIYVGFIRFACANGMVAGKSFFSERIIHRTGDTAESKLKGISEGIEGALDYMYTDFSTQCSEATAVPLTTEKMIYVVENLNVLSKRTKDNVIDSIVRPHSRREADRENNLWTLWNLANEQLKFASRSEFRNSQKNINLFDDIKKLAA